MKHFIILNLAFLLISVSMAAPKLTAVNPNYDFGTVREGINVPVEFTIKNTGTQPARIDKILQSTHCVTSGSVPEEKLAPGESIQLEFRFQSLGYGDVDVSKWIEIHYNDKNSPLKLTVTGHVTPVEPFQAPVGELMYNFFVLVDIRSEAQFHQSHIAGAIHVPENQLMEWGRKIAPNLKDDVLFYLYSETGIKSDKMAKQLQKQGISNCYSLVGGLKEWKKRYATEYLVSGKY